MANFSAKERLLASFLSATPRLKSVIKQIYIIINSIIHHKNYNLKLLDPRIKKVNLLKGNLESFGGYYDATSVNDLGWVLFNESSHLTSKKPSSKYPVTIYAYNINTGEKLYVSESMAYNWQQGSRAQWLDNDTAIFNVFRDDRYMALVYSVSKQEIIKTFNYPVQYAYNKEYFLSVNYRRIMALRPDYGYRCLSRLSSKELRCLDNDGIWYVSYETSRSKLLLSLKEIVDFKPKYEFLDALHKVNHVMIKPDGKGFIFIHRWYKGRRRFDRLLYYDFKSLRVLADNGMVSHMCWLNDNTLFGYLRNSDKNGFYFIDIGSGHISTCSAVTGLATGDGHPTVHNDFVAFDSYPDKSRMQTLYLYNAKDCSIIPLLELHHGLKYIGESRCDLHPRFSNDGKYLFFDSVYSGKRSICYIDLSQVIL